MNKKLLATLFGLGCAAFCSLNVFAGSLANGEAIIWNNGEAETLSIEDLINVHSSNALRWQSNYDTTKIMSIDTIKEIKLDDFVVLENDSYTPKVVIYTDNGLAVSVRSDNPVLQSVNVGETIQITGTITGFLKYADKIGIINTNGNGTDIQKYTENSSEEENLFLMICDYATNNNYKDVSEWSQFFTSQYPEKEETIEQLSLLSDKISENCYLGTFIKKYDIACGGVTSVSELSVADYGEGYDYEDSNLASNIQLYGTYLKNQGYQDKGLANGTVNGVEDTYELFSNSDGVNIGLAQGPSGSTMRVVIYAPEAIAKRIVDETYGTTDDTDPSKEYITYYTNHDVNVRSIPSTEGEKLTTLAAGETVSVISIDGDWAEIDHNGTTAYVSAQFIQETMPR